ncbi:MAG: ATP-binding protein [Prevotellaceae bacterium]|jgi:hypothetical protein|nr:ATP-binding protein [Prevotellaceae bacterium]
MKKKLPVGIQSFSKLRTNGFVYVDKTEHIYKMIDDGSSIYFLSRPRRFGKSLLVSTLDALFSGRKELFEGLYIYDKWDWTQPHPVIRLDFGSIANNTSEALSNSLADFVKEVATKHRITIEKTELPDKFAELIKKIALSSGKQVVVLVDEYDKPIIDHLSNPETLDANKSILHDFYQVLKASDDYIKFIFLTGVSKFSGLSVFSALNNLDDITLNMDYGSICCYTQEELESYFSEYIDIVARDNSLSTSELLDRIKVWYTGYSWDGKASVYNPFSTLSFFRNREFNNYWFRTATPTFLIEILKKRDQLEPVLRPVEVGSGSFDSYDPLCINEIPLLFQTGYLTVKRKESSLGTPQYTLGIPNEEVRKSFLEHLVNAYSHYPVERMQRLIADMQKQIRAGDASALEQNLRLLLAHIPNILHVENEKYYHSLFLLLMRTLGFDIHGEVLTNIGRIDAVWRQSELTVVAEVKYHAEKSIESLLGEAMSQICDRKYYEAYLDREVMLMAVAFAGKEVKCSLKKVGSPDEAGL